MGRIKFVLWERYRAWWGAHQLNKENPEYASQIASRSKDNLEKSVRVKSDETGPRLMEEFEEVVEKSPEELEEERIARREAMELAKRLAEQEKLRQEKQAEKERQDRERQRLIDSKFKDLEDRAEAKAKKVEATKRKP